MIPHPADQLPHSTDDAVDAAVEPARSGVQLLRVLVHQSGPQRTTVTITERHDRPVLHIRAGAVFVYASAPEVVASHLAAWRDTSLAARHVLVADEAVMPTNDSPSGFAEVSVIVREDATPAVAVTRYPVDPMRPGRPAYIETVTGPLTTRSYDRHAIADVLGVWMQAAALGAIVWASPALADL